MKTTFITIVLLFTTLVIAIANPPIGVEIRNQIKKKYQNSHIIEIENEHGLIEVKIIHQHKEKEVVFNSSGIWQSTKYDIMKSELPEKVKRRIKKSRYSSYRIDDIEAIETPSESLYEIELDPLFSDDITIYVTFDGVIL